MSGLSCSLCNQDIFPPSLMNLLPKLERYWSIAIGVSFDSLRPSHRQYCYFCDTSNGHVQGDILRIEYGINSLIFLVSQLLIIVETYRWLYFRSSGGSSTAAGLAEFPLYRFRCESGTGSRNCTYRTGWMFQCGERSDSIAQPSDTVRKILKGGERCRPSLCV